MNILLAADGSRYTKKALAFLMVHENLRDPDTEVVVINVQAALPPHATRHLGKQVVSEYYSEASDQVLRSIETFLTRRKVPHRVVAAVGAPATEIVKAAKKHKSNMIVMGTHGHGLLGRIALGSVAQRVVAESEVPVLLVK